MTEQKKIDGRTRRAADIALAKRQISPASYRALVEEGGRITLQQAKELGRDRGPDDSVRAADGPGTATRIVRSGSGTDDAHTAPQPVSRISKNDTTQECWCGCQERTSPGKRWKIGHDQKGKGIIRRAVKDGKVAELSLQLREYGGERGLI